MALIAKHPRGDVGRLHPERLECRLVAWGIEQTVHKLVRVRRFIFLCECDLLFELDCLQGQIEPVGVVLKRLQATDKIVVTYKPCNRETFEGGTSAATLWLSAEISSRQHQTMLRRLAHRAKG